MPLAKAPAFGGPVQGNGAGSILTDRWQRAGRRRLDGRPLTAIVTMLAGAVIGGELILHTHIYYPQPIALDAIILGDGELPMRTAGRCAHPRAKLYRR